MVKNAEQSNKTFKILSFFAIYFVVSGHLSFGGIPMFYEWFTVYSFHIPLLCFISGYFFKDKYTDAPIRYILKKFKRHIIPLYIWNLIYGLLTAFLRNYHINYGEALNIHSLLIAPLTDGHQFKLYLAAWFVFPLFCVEVFNVLFRWFLKKIKLHNEWMISVVYMGIGILATSITTGENTGWSLAALRSMFMLAFFGFGTLYNRKLEKIDTMSNIWYFAIVFGIQFIVTCFDHHSLIYLVSWMREFNGGPVVPFITGITGILFWLRISKILTPALGNSRAVNYVADHTADIMRHHFLGFFVFNTIVFIIWKNFFRNAFEFNYVAYYTDADYNMKLSNIPYISVIYVLFGFAVSLGIGWLCDKMKNYISGKITGSGKTQSTES